MQDDKTKLKLLVDMVKALSKRVQFLSHMTGLSDIDIKFQDNIKDIEKDIEQ